MKTIYLHLSAILYSVFLFSCEENNPDINTLVTKFSNLECRAYTLREKRYELADKIRFTEDSVQMNQNNQKSGTALKGQLKLFLKEKETVTKESLQLADTIRLQLDSIVKFQLKTEEKIHQSCYLGMPGKNGF